LEQNMCVVRFDIVIELINRPPSVNWIKNPLKLIFVTIIVNPYNNQVSRLLQCMSEVTTIWVHSCYQWLCHWMLPLHVSQSFLIPSSFLVYHSDTLMTSCSPHRKKSSGF
jgi:hypothetical protein